MRNKEVKKKQAELFMTKLRQSENVGQLILIDAKDDSFPFGQFLSSYHEDDLETTIGLNMSASCNKSEKGGDF